jgi:hypothetical protein
MPIKFKMSSTPSTLGAGAAHSGMTSPGSLAITADQLSVLLERDAKEAGETQLQRYERLGAARPVLDIVRRGGGPAMGAQCERILRGHWPSLEKRQTKKASGSSNTGYDHRIKEPIADVYKKLEQKTSGLWSEEENDFHWQHIEIDHPWDGLLLVGLGLQGILAWGMRREDFMACVADGRATNQGNKEKNSSEGIWMLYRNIHSCLIPLSSEDDLLAFSSSL